MATPIMIEHLGMKKSITGWARFYNIPVKTLQQRLKRMSLSEATNHPLWGARTITAMGETLTAFQWSKRTGVSRHTILARLRSGWSEEEAITIEPMRSVIVSYEGEKIRLSELSKRCGIHCETLRYRIFKKGMPPEVAARLATNGHGRPSKKEK